VDLDLEPKLRTREALPPHLYIFTWRAAELRTALPYYFKIVDVVLTYSNKAPGCEFFECRTGLTENLKGLIGELG
jgi:hypothetical protein